MDIVIDASVIIAVIANEPEKEALLELTRGADLLSPQSVHWEIGNAFSAMLKRKRISLDQSLRAIQVYRKIPIRFLDIDLAPSLEIANELGIFAYDAYLVQCALKYKAPLVSLDKSLIVAAERLKVRVLRVVL